MGRSFQIQKLALFALLVAGTSHAQIVQYNFTDTNAASATITAASTNYINPASSFNILTLAGLDRKIHLTITNGTTTSFDQTSGLITVTDRLTDKSGAGFYGKSFTVSKLAEGTYTIKSIVLDVNGATVSTNSYTLVVDRTAPTYGKFSWGMNYGAGTAPDGIPRFSTTEARYIALSGVTDSLSGIGDATFETYWLDGANAGSLYASGSVPYDSSTQIAQLGTGGMNSVGTGQFPGNVQNKIKMTYIIKDKAGNKASSDLVFYDNSKCSTAPTLVAIADPTYSGSYLGQSVFAGFREVPTAGPTPVHINPVKAVYRWPRDQNRWTTEGQIYGAYPIGSNQGLVYSDANYAYTIVNGTITDKGYYNFPLMGWTNAATWRCGPLYVTNAQFDAAALPPRMVGAQVYIDGVGWVPNGYKGLDAPENVKITQVKMTVQARTYDQTVSGYGSCSVPAGSTECIATVNVDFKKTGTIGLANPEVRATNPITGAGDTIIPLLWEYDAQPPVYSELLTNNTNSKQVVFSAIEYNAGAIWNRVKMANGGLTATNKATGVVTRLYGSQQTSGATTIFTTSYASLGDGNYTLSAWAQDNYNNQFTQTLFDVTVDGSAPTITFSGVSSGGITKIDNLLVKVTDAADASPIVTAVSLVGGPIADNLSLGFSKQSDGYYHLEAPRMFPSTSDTEGYTIKVTAQDNQGNVTTANTSFLLTPENLVALGTIKGLAVNKNLLDSSNKPLTYAQITTVKTAAGATATGAQQAYFTLRRDAKFAVVVNGVTVQPGETKDFTLTLDNTGGAVLPIYPAVGGTTGDAAFMIDVPQLVSN